MVAGQLTLAPTNLLTKLLCEHAQLELSRAESSLISPLSSSETEWGLHDPGKRVACGGMNAEARPAHLQTFLSKVSG